MLSKFKTITLTWAATMLLMGSFTWHTAQAQVRKDIFQPGEELIYSVKYGFLTLGTVVIQTGNISPAGDVKAHMEFWTANIPFLHTRTSITDQFSVRDITLRSFEEHTQNGSHTADKFASYDPATQTLTYSDDSVQNQVSYNIQPFDDALGILFNMRAWSGAVGHTYLFHVRSRDEARPVKLTFTNQISNQSVPALDDKEIPTRVLQGVMDMGNASPLGANGDFTAYVSNDAAAIPVRIDMQIAVGSISLVLDKVKRNDWAANY